MRRWQEPSFRRETARCHCKFRSTYGCECAGSFSSFDTRPRGTWHGHVHMLQC